MGFLSSAGSLLNDITGATSAGKASQKYSIESAKINNAYQKEFAQNGHQWEVEDLKKAGLNPVLSANNGANASGGGVNNANMSATGINPIETAIGAWNGYENARNTGADTNKKQAEIDNVNADTLLKQYQSMTEIAKYGATEAERKLAETKAYEILKTLGANIDKIKAETKYTNERARGFTESRSYEGGAHGALNIWGGEAGANAKYHYTTTK